MLYSWLWDCWLRRPLVVPRWAASGWMPSAKAWQRSSLRHMVSEASQGKLCQILVAFLQARLRVLHGPPPGAQVLDDLEGAKHQPIPGLQVPGALRQGPAVLGADRAGPHEVEVPLGRLVQFHDVAADGGLELGVQVHGNDLPAPSREGPANRPRPTEELEKPRHLLFCGSHANQIKATSPATRQATSRLQITQSRQVMGGGGWKGSWSDESIPFFWLG